MELQIMNFFHLVKIVTLIFGCLLPEILKIKIYFRYQYICFEAETGSWNLSCYEIFWLNLVFLFLFICYRSLCELVVLKEECLINPQNFQILGMLLFEKLLILDCFADSYFVLFYFMESFLSFYSWLAFW